MKSLGSKTPELVRFFILWSFQIFRNFENPFTGWRQWRKTVIYVEFWHININKYIPDDEQTDSNRRTDTKQTPDRADRRQTLPPDDQQRHLTHRQTSDATKRKTQQTDTQTNEQEVNKQTATDTKQQTDTQIDKQQTDHQPAKGSRNIRSPITDSQESASHPTSAFFWSRVPKVDMSFLCVVIFIFGQKLLLFSIFSSCLLRLF